MKSIEKNLGSKEGIFLQDQTHIAFFASVGASEQNETSIPIGFFAQLRKQTVQTIRISTSNFSQF